MNGDLVAQAHEGDAEFSILGALGAQPSRDGGHFLLRLCE
jgi:hypothetical protein